MPTFKLNKDTILRMKKAFYRFENARKLIHENIINYIADYRQFNGTSQDRKEFLEDEYRNRIPTLNSLLFGEDENFLWHVDDIVILTGLSQPSISRIFSAMEKSEGWCAKIISLRVETKSANNNLIYAYREEIFDLIIDYQEAKFLERFLKPRRGTPPDKNEIIRYWEYLKSSLQNDFDHEHITPEELPEIPSMKSKDIFMLILRKIFGAKILTLSSIFFAVTFELSRRWNFFIIFFTLISILIFMICFFMLKIRKGRAGFISDVGAAAMLSMIFLALGAFSDGIIFTPSGMALPLNNKDHKIWLAENINDGHVITFMLMSDFYDDIKDVYYRTNSKENFISTGSNGSNYPNLEFKPETQNGKINLEIKYKDSQNKEHGVFKFPYDMDKLRFDLSKNFLLNENTSWFSVRNYLNEYVVYLYIDNRFADEVVESVFLGINKSTPDKEIKIDYTKPKIELRFKDVQYVSSYLRFKDGTISETRTQKANK